MSQHGEEIEPKEIELFDPQYPITRNTNYMVISGQPRAVIAAAKRMDMVISCGQYRRGKLDLVRVNFDTPIQREDVIDTFLDIRERALNILRLERS